MRILEAALADVSGGVFAGDIVFKLYDTYGFPADMTADVARARGIEIDQKGYDEALAKQRERSQAEGAFDVDLSGGLQLEFDTEFVGYDRLEETGKVLAIVRGDELVDGFGSDFQGDVLTLETIKDLLEFQVEDSLYGTGLEEIEENYGIGSVEEFRAEVVFQFISYSPLLA